MTNEKAKRKKQKSHEFVSNQNFLCSKLYPLLSTLLLCSSEKSLIPASVYLLLRYLKICCYIVLFFTCKVKAHDSNNFQSVLTGTGGIQ